jgi:hypothetical protein
MDKLITIGKMTVFRSKRISRGLNAYAKVSRFRPLLGSITLFEGLLSLMGISMLILWLMSGSFENAGLAMDHFFSLIINPVAKFFDTFKT